MLGLDLSLIISFGTLLVTFFNVYQVYNLNIEFHKKSKVYDKKFEVISQLEELLVLCKIDITSIIKYYMFADEKPQKTSGKLSDIVNKFKTAEKENKNVDVNNNTDKSMATD